MANTIKTTKEVEELFRDTCSGVYGQPITFGDMSSPNSSGVVGGWNTITTVHEVYAQGPDFPPANEQINLSNSVEITYITDFVFTLALNSENTPEDDFGMVVALTAAGFLQTSADLSKVDAGVTGLFCRLSTWLYRQRINVDAYIT